MKERTLIVLTPENPREPYGGLGVHDANVSEELQQIGWSVVRVTLPSVEGPDLVQERLRGNRLITLDLPGDSTAVVLAQGHWLGQTLEQFKLELPSLRVIATIHSLERDRPRREEFLGPRYRDSIRLESLTVRYADTICTVSEWMVRRIKACYPAISNSIHNIGNGVSSVFFGARSLPVPDQPRIAFVGRVEPEKGLLEFLAILMDLRQEVPGIRLDVFGSTRPVYRRYREELDRKISCLELTQQVVWHGFVRDRTALSRIYRTHKAVIIPSLYEPFGLVALEAMASGGLVSARPVGGLTEVISHGTNGLFYENAGDVLNALRLASAVDGDIRAAAARTARRYSWQAVAHRLHRLLLGGAT